MPYNETIVREETRKVAVVPLKALKHRIVVMFPVVLAESASTAVPGFLNRRGPLGCAGYGSAARSAVIPSPCFIRA